MVRLIQRGAVVAVLFAVLLLTLIIVREWAFDMCSPWMIDYDAPGVDITSEGP